MTDRHVALDNPEWLALFEDVQDSWFRLETLQAYAVDYEEAEFADFARTGRVDDSQTPWRRMIRRHVDAGRSLRRVHIVEEPLSDYLRYELALYEQNAKAGEDIALIPTEHGTWPNGLPTDLDFWLFDDREVWDMHYDMQGRFIEAVRNTSTEYLDQCRRWRDRALTLATPLHTYALPSHR